MLADVEDLTLSRIYPQNRTFLRLFVDAGADDPRERVSPAPARRRRVAAPARAAVSAPPARGRARHRGRRRVPRHDATRTASIGSSRRPRRRSSACRSRRRSSTSSRATRRGSPSCCARIPSACRRTSRARRRPRVDRARARRDGAPSPEGRRAIARRARASQGPAAVRGRRGVPARSAREAARSLNGHAAANCRARSRCDYSPRKNATPATRAHGIRWCKMPAVKRFVFPQWTETLKKWISLLALGAPVYLVALIAYGVTPRGDPHRLSARSTGAVQPRAARRRARHRLPLLPHDRRARSEGGDPAGGDVHELPLDGAARTPTCCCRSARRSRRTTPVQVDARPRPAGLRLLQPHGARERGDRLRDAATAASIRWSRSIRPSR